MEKCSCRAVVSNDDFREALDLGYKSRSTKDTTQDASQAVSGSNVAQHEGLKQVSGLL
jgi:hypothetical protein